MVTLDAPSVREIALLIDAPGIVFVDVNKDGKRQTGRGVGGEAGVPGARIVVYDVPAPGAGTLTPVKVGEGFTNSAGVFLVSGPWSEGDKTVVIDPVPGYNKVNPIPVSDLCCWLRARCVRTSPVMESTNTCTVVTFLPLPRYHGE